MPNEDYILRSDVLKVLCDKCVFEPRCSRENEFCNKIQGMKTIPAADVEPKRSTGWWIPGDYVAVEHGECVTYTGEGITCSWCHYGFKARFLWSRDYCPHCGSRMLPEPPKEENHDSL